MQVVYYTSIYRRYIRKYTQKKYKIQNEKMEEEAKRKSWKYVWRIIFKEFLSKSTKFQFDSLSRKALETIPLTQRKLSWNLICGIKC